MKKQPIVMPQQRWVPTSKPDTAQREFRGVNRLDAFSIREEFASDTINLTGSNYPALTMRPGFSVLGTFGSRIIGMGVYKETELHVIADNGTWQRLNGDGTWTQLATGLDVSTPWSFTNFKGNLSAISLIASNGTTPRYYNGSTVQTLANVPAGAKFITQFSDRLFAAVGNELWASAYRMADNWSLPVNPNDEAASAWNTVIESDDGETINSIQAGLDKLVVTKRTATFMLFGYDPTDYTVRPITFDQGQFNERAGVTYDNWLYQLSDNGLYKLAGGGIPRNDFAERIRAYFNGLIAADQAASVIADDGSKIYLAIGTTLIEYDPLRDTFFPWSGINARHIVSFKGSTYIGDAAGRVLKLGGTSDGGAPINWRWVSKAFTAQSMSQGIRWFRLWATVDLPAGSTMRAYVSPSAKGDDWVLAGEVTGSGSLLHKPIYFRSNTLPPTQQIRVKFEGAGPMTLYEWAREEEHYPLR